MHETLTTLRQALKRLEGRSATGRGATFALGLPPPGAPLRLPRGAVHEALAESEADAPAASGFGLGLALGAAAGPLVWIRHDAVEAFTGSPYPPGLSAFGADRRLVLSIRAGRAREALQAALEAVRCASLGAALLELWGDTPLLDLTASRRLALAAERSGVPLFLIRMGAAPQPSAAVTRWSVRPILSAPLEANAPGAPAFAATLLRHRGGAAGGVFHMEWDRDRRTFRAIAARSCEHVERLAAPAAASSGVVAAFPAHGPAAEAAGSDFRRAG